MEKKKVLLVDDEKDFTNIVKLNIEKTGMYEVAVENNGSNAVSAARKFKPDIIFLDIMMPEKDGCEVAEEIRKDVDLKDIPIVFLTAIITGEEVSERGHLVGGLPFLAKPVSSEQLLDAIKKHLK